MRLLKKLRTTARRHLQAKNLESLNLLKKQVSCFRRFVNWKTAACLSVTLLTGSASFAAQPAQYQTSQYQTSQFQTSQFQSPQLPPLSQQQQNELQSRLHAEAIKSQMIRAEREQAAPAGFAQQAFQAQQAYAAEQAYEHQMSYLNKRSQTGAQPQQDTQTQRVAYNQPQQTASNQTQRITTQYQAAAARPSHATYAPPVHIQPMKKTAPNPGQYAAQMSAINSRSGYQDNVRSASNQYAAPAPSVAIAMSDAKPIRTQTNQRQLSQFASRPRFVQPVQSVQQPTGSSGLQNRIANALTRKRRGENPNPAVRPVREPESRQNVQGTQGSSQRLMEMELVRTNSVARRPAKKIRPRTPQRHDEPQSARELQTLRDSKSTQATDVRNRIEKAMATHRRPVVRQAAMQSPIQDPFADSNSANVSVPQDFEPQSFQSKMEFEAPIQQSPTYQVPKYEPPTYRSPPNSTPTFQAQSYGTPKLEAPTPVQSNIHNPFSDPQPDVENSTKQKTRGQQISILNEAYDMPEEPSFQDQDGDLGGDFGEAGDQDMGRAELENELKRRMDGIESLHDDSDEFDDFMDRTNNLRSQDDDDREPKSLLELDDEDGMGDEDDEKPSLLDRSCDEFRADLLGGSIRDIPLDISPPASELRDQYAAIPRSWTDRFGNTIATGTMTDLRRGYVVLDGQQKIAFARLSDADLAAVAEYWKIPRICTVGNRGSVERCWIPQTFTWTATSLCHKPLYFENVQLERYGHSHGPYSQPFHSVGHFFSSLVTIPYQMGIHPANECQYALGYYRPGDCAPWLKDPIPISLNGMRNQAMVATGLAIIP